MKNIEKWQGISQNNNRLRTNKSSRPYERMSGSYRIRRFGWR
jgi:hypothetical protein